MRLRCKRCDFEQTLEGAVPVAKLANHIRSEHGATAHDAIEEARRISAEHNTSLAPQAEIDRLRAALADAEQRAAGLLGVLTQLDTLIDFSQELNARDAMVFQDTALINAAFRAARDAIDDE